MTPWVQALVPEPNTHKHEPLREAAPPSKKKLELEARALFKIELLPGIVAHTCDTNTWEAEAGG